MKFNYISHPTLHNLCTQIDSITDPENWPRATKKADHKLQELPAINL